MTNRLLVLLLLMTALVLTQSKSHNSEEKEKEKEKRASGKLVSSTPSTTDSTSLSEKGSHDWDPYHLHIVLSEKTGFSKDLLEKRNSDSNKLSETNLIGKSYHNYFFSTFSLSLYLPHPPCSLVILIYKLLCISEPSTTQKNLQLIF